MYLQRILEGSDCKMNHRNKLNEDKIIRNHIKDAKRRIELVQYELKLNDFAFAKIDIRSAKYHLKKAKQLLKGIRTRKEKKVRKH